MANFSSFFWYNYGIWTPQNCHSDLVECCVIVMGSKVGKKHKKHQKHQGGRTDNGLHWRRKKAPKSTKSTKSTRGSDEQRLA